MSTPILLLFFLIKRVVNILKKKTKQNLSYTLLCETCFKKIIKISTPNFINNHLRYHLVNKHTS